MRFIHIWLPYFIMLFISGFIIFGLLFLIPVPKWVDDWIRPCPIGNKDNADVFIAFGFGLVKDEYGKEIAGRSNEEIAEWIIENNTLKKPVIMQEGVYLAFMDLREKSPKLDTGEIIRLPHDPKVYVDTYGATLQSWAIMNLMGFQKPVIVSHDLQMQRMAWNFEKVGFKGQLIIPGDIRIGYDQQSSQHWGTRSRRNWIIWELFFARPVNYILRRI